MFLKRNYLQMMKNVKLKRRKAWINFAEPTSEDAWKIKFCLILDKISRPYLIMKYWYRVKLLQQIAANRQLILLNQKLKRNRFYNGKKTISFFSIRYIQPIPINAGNPKMTTNLFRLKLQHFFELKYTNFRLKDGLK